MKVLDRIRWQKALDYIDTHARPIDRAFAHYYFSGGSATAVRDALTAFQNADGGFGQSMEPDFRLDASSPLATSVALQYAVEIGLGADDPMMQRAVQYLVTSFDSTANRWHAVPLSVNEAPHAPWWTVDAKTGRSGVEDSWANPSAELVGYLWRYRAWVPDDFLERATDMAMRALEDMPAQCGLHNFLCYQRLADMMAEPLKSRILALLRSALPLTVDTDPASWAHYGAEPLALAPSPQAPFVSALAQSIPANLDYRIEQQQEDGSWRPNWSWFGQYDDVWPQSEQEWAGYLTVKNLKTLQDFGRVTRMA